ncbi:MAG TPA: allene oxide cyclase family protein [Actinomycetota bacterium]|nr:allene oxide cyclase family protein [Actinomycetota bacterium]
MGTKLRMLVAAASVCALVIVIALSSSAFGVTRMTVTVVEHATSDAVVDIGGAGDTEGDILWFANDVYDEADVSVVGSDQGQCFRTSVPNGAWECSWTTFLDDGSLTVEGPFYDASDSVLAITGGTGVFRRAQGQMRLHCYVGDDQIGRCRFTFKIALP